jgi:hypothetical protein
MIPDILGCREYLNHSSHCVGAVEAALSTSNDFHTVYQRCWQKLPGWNARCRRPDANAIDKKNRRIGLIPSQVDRCLLTNSTRCLQGDARLGAK